MNRITCLFAIATLAACASEPSTSEAPPASGESTRYTGKTLVYECSNGGDFIVRTGPGEIALWLEDKYRVLSQVRSGSGTKYQEGDIVFWSKGAEAMLDDGETPYRDCLPNPRRVPWEDARRRGVDLRAIGNEPGWHVEVREGDSILLVGDYGATKYLFRDFSIAREGSTVTYAAVKGGDQLTLTSSADHCADTMSGEQFPLTVQAELNGRVYQGCGMTLDHPWE